MSITAISADGVKHVFPDGTSVAVIGKVMKSYAQAHAEEPPSMASSFGMGAVKGLGDAALGIGQLAGNILVPSAPVSPPPGDTDPGSLIQNKISAGLSGLDAMDARYQSAHPIINDVGQIAGQAIPSLAPAGAMGDLARGASWAERTAKAARLGGVFGAEQPVSGQTSPNTGPAYWEEKTKQVTENALTSAAFGQIFEGINAGVSGISRWLARNNPDAIKSQAVQKIVTRMAQDEKSGKPKAQDVFDLIHKSRAAGVPLSMMESGGTNLKSLAGAVARGKGAGRAIVENSFKDRLKGSAQRLTNSVRENFGAPETMRTVREALSESQYQASKPLYDEAMKPGSIAPLKVQFEKAFNDVSRVRKEAQTTLNQAKQGLTLASAKLARAGSDVYSNASAIEELKAAQANIDDAQEVARAAETLHEKYLNQLRQAQKAEAAGERGGIWSPHIARLVENPKVKQGIQAGLRIQRDEADARNTTFNPRDYAVTGYDANGDPVVSKVPNMRLLDAAKKGLDDMLESYRSEVTGRLNLDEQGRKINELRLALLSEIDRINPSYKAARAAWAGPAASKGAMAQGTKIMSMHPEDVKAIFDDLSPSEQEHFKIGAAQAYLDAISENGLVASQIRKLARDDSESMARARLAPLFQKKEQLDKFIAAVEGERAIHETRQTVVGGSPTATRLAEDMTPELEAGLHAAHGIGHAAHGNIIGAAASFLRVRRNLGLVQNPRVNEEIARILSDSEFAPEQLLKAAPPKKPVQPFNPALSGAASDALMQKANQNP